MAMKAAFAARTAGLDEARKSQAAAERRCGQLDSQQMQLEATLSNARDEIQVLQEEAAALEAEHAETTARTERLEGSCQEAAAKVASAEAAARAAVESPPRVQARQVALDLLIRSKAGTWQC